jgi:hypothetical protein
MIGKDSFISYPPEKGDNSIININDNFSEINNLLISTWDSVCAEKKVFIFGYPNFSTPLFPILLYNTTKLIDRDVLFVTNNAEQYLEQYELLGNTDYPGYLYNDCIPLLINEDGAEVKLIPKRIPKKIRIRDMEALFEEANEPNKRKVIFCSYLLFSRALQKDQNTIIQELKKNINLDIDIGAIIFDNLDLIYSDDLEKFSSWALEMSKNGKPVFVKVYDVYSNVVSLLMKHSNAHGLIYNHPFLKKYSGEFASKHTRYDLLPDKMAFSGIEIENMGKNNNLHNLKKELDLIYLDLKRSIPRMPEFIWPLIGLKNKLLSLIVHPSDFKFVVLDKSAWTSKGISEYLNYIEGLFKTEDIPDKEKLISFLSTFKTFYRELEQTYRYGQQYHFNKRCKNSFLMEILSKKDLEKNPDKINIIVFSKKGEKETLKKNIQELNLKNLKVEVITFYESLKKEYLEGMTYLPGIPYKASDLIRLRYICERLSLIVYDEEQEDLFSDNSLEKITENYMNESIGLIKDNASKGLFSSNKFPQTMKIIEEKQDVKEQPNKEQENEFENPLYFESNMEKANVNVLIHSYSGAHVKENLLLLEHVNTKKITSYNCGANTPFIRIDDDGEFYNSFFSELEVGDRILKFGYSEDEDLLSIISKLYGLEETIDIDIIRSWKSYFRDWIIHFRNKIKEDTLNAQKTTLRQIYLNYKNKCLSMNTKPKTEPAFHGWVAEKRIGPEDENDVLILGSLSNFPDIEKEYKTIYKQMAQLRTAHIIVGRKISKVIRYLLSKNDQNDLDFQEQILYDKIKLFKIIDKKSGSIINENSKNVRSDLDKEKKVSKKKTQEIDQEEHEKRVKYLKDIGILK